MVFMTPSEDVSTLGIPQPHVGSLSPRLQKLQTPIDSPAVASPKLDLSLRASNTSLSSLFASTTTSRGSRSASPNPLRGVSRSLGTSTFESSSVEDDRYSSPADKARDPRNLILQAFVPHIAVLTSLDTKELVNGKGFKNDLWELLRPFGERIQGKVTVRDSTGSGKTWEDFAVRFIQFEETYWSTRDTNPLKEVDGEAIKGSNGDGVPDLLVGQRARTGKVISSIETLVDRHLTHAENLPSLNENEELFSIEEPQSSDMPSPFYMLYLRRLITGIPVAPHETFSHPVACIIAISSRNKSPIETLRQLYDESSQGEKKLPVWVHNEYLRYYVLVHDEDKDDIAQSMDLFDQMKLRFGLHCHLLRLRSTRSKGSNDDSVEFPSCDWLSAPEELARINASESKENYDDNPLYVYKSDVTALKTFIREMVTQSIVPFMERCVSTWNDQIASRRKGLSGRILSISKQWVGFGRSSKNSSSGSGSLGSNSNYDPVQGYYQADSPEALMRKLADYAFMLRDWKLALSTYDLLRSDFNTDKAWKYHAAVNEMAAISALLVPKSMSSKTRAETVDRMLELASYSYTTRCASTDGTLRCLTLAIELLKLRNGAATLDAARWGLRLLEYKAVGVIGDALLKERISACYASKRGVGTRKWGSRTRKSALWNIQAADSWLTLGKPRQSMHQLNEVKRKYALLVHKDSLETYDAANHFLESLRREVQLALLPDFAPEETGELPDIEIPIEESEGFDSRPHRRSVMGGIAPPLSGLATTPLKATSFDAEDAALKPDQFA